MIEFRYCVHSDIDDNNIFAEFQREQEAIDYAKGFSKDDKVFVVEVTVETDEDGEVIRELDSEVIWAPEEEIELDEPFKIDDWAEIEYAKPDSLVREPTLKEAHETLEENEDLVECQHCFELFPKADCIKVEYGYLCPTCGKLHVIPPVAPELVDYDTFELEFPEVREYDSEFDGDETEDEVPVAVENPEISAPVTVNPADEFENTPVSFAGEPISDSDDSSDDSDGLAEDYTGTPEIRTTHLEYEDKDVTDEKAVLPDNITKKEDDHCKKYDVINHDADDKGALKESLAEFVKREYDVELDESLSGILLESREDKVDQAAAILGHKFKIVLQKAGNNNWETRPVDGKVYTNIKKAIEDAKKFSTLSENNASKIIGIREGSNNPDQGELIYNFENGKTKTDWSKEYIKKAGKKKADDKTAHELGLDQKEEPKQADEQKPAEPQKSEEEKELEEYVKQVQKDLLAMERGTETFDIKDFKINKLKNYIKVAEEAGKYPNALEDLKAEFDNRNKPAEEPKAEEKPAEEKPTEAQAETQEPEEEASAEATSVAKMTADEARGALEKAYPGRDKPIHNVLQMLRKAGLIESIEINNNEVNSIIDQAIVDELNSLTEEYPLDEGLKEWLKDKLQKVGNFLKGIFSSFTKGGIKGIIGKLGGALVGGVLGSLLIPGLGTIGGLTLGAAGGAIAEDGLKDVIDKIMSAASGWFKAKRRKKDKKVEKCETELERLIGKEAGDNFIAELDNMLTNPQSPDTITEPTPVLSEAAADIPFDSDVKVGTKIRIGHLEGEGPDYDGKEGEVTNIDSIGQLHGTWGGLAVIPGVDDFEVITEDLKNLTGKTIGSLSINFVEDIIEPEYNNYIVRFVISNDLNKTDVWTKDTAKTDIEVDVDFKSAHENGFVMSHPAVTFESMKSDEKISEADAIAMLGCSNEEFRQAVAEILNSASRIFNDTVEHRNLWDKEVDESLKEDVNKKYIVRFDFSAFPDFGDEIVEETFDTKEEALKYIEDSYDNWYFDNFDVSEEVIFPILCAAQEDDWDEDDNGNYILESLKKNLVEGALEAELDAFAATLGKKEESLEYTCDQDLKDNRQPKQDDKIEYGKTLDGTEMRKHEAGIKEQLEKELKTEQDVYNYFINKWLDCDVDRDLLEVAFERGLSGKGLPTKWYGAAYLGSSDLDYLESINAIGKDVKTKGIQYVINDIVDCEADDHQDAQDLREHKSEDAELKSYHYITDPSGIEGDIKAHSREEARKAIENELAEQGIYVGDEIIDLTEAKLQESHDEKFTSEEQEEYGIDEDGVEIDGWDEWVHCGWCGEPNPKSDCRYELNMGWLCKNCQAALYSRGEKGVWVDDPDELD